MVRNRSHYAFLNRALRFCFILLMLTALNIPHLGMAAGMQEPATAMMHAGQTHDAMTDVGNIHDKMGPPFVRPFALGPTGLIARPFHSGFLAFVSFRGFGEIERAWPLVAPDAAPRPPDPLRKA